MMDFHTLSKGCPGEECELHVDGSGAQTYILVLVTGFGVAIGRDQLTFCIYGVETIAAIGYFVEYDEMVFGSSKEETPI